MSLTEDFIAKARATGATAEAFPLHELASRLTALIAETGVKSAVLAKLSALPGVETEISAMLAAAGCRVLAPEQAADAELGITIPDALLAETGSQAVFSTTAGAMKASLLPPIHLALASPESLLPNIASLLVKHGSVLPSRLTLVSGPSRTGDIEATMTTGVHGPGRVLVWILTGPPK